MTKKRRRVSTPLTLSIESSPSLGNSMIAQRLSYWVHQPNSAHRRKSSKKRDIKANERGSNARASSNRCKQTPGAVRVIKARDEEKMQQIINDLMKPKQR